MTFPKIQRACPVQSSLDKYMDGDVCRLCCRQVHDLNAITPSERRAFLDACSDEVCVSYRLPIKHVAAAVTLSAAAIATPAMAENTQLVVDETRAGYEDLPKCADEHQYELIIVGGIKTPSDVEYVETAEDLEVPELPVVYETDS